MKPDFKRPAQQRRATIDNGILKNFSVKGFFTTGYKRRWFILNTETSMLEYFESDHVGRSKHVRLGVIDLNDVKSIEASRVFDAPPYSIDLQCSSNVYTLAADSAEIISNWNVVLSKEIDKLRCQREIRANRVNHSIAPQRYITRSDFPPHQLVSTIMSYCDPQRSHQYASPVLWGFYSRIVTMLLNPSARFDKIDSASLEFEGRIHEVNF
jgi:hypothetical protein